MKFGGDERVEAEMTSVVVSAARLRPGSWTLRASAGVIVDGTLRPGAGPAHAVDDGLLLAVGVARDLRPGGGMVPALDFAATLGAAWAETGTPTGASADYSAFDLRLGLRGAWRLGDHVFPYAAARVFGGPVNWSLDGEDLQGSDVHHYQLAVGTAARFGRLALQFEWSVVGERGIGGGLGLTW